MGGGIKKQYGHLSGGHQHTWKASIKNPVLASAKSCVPGRAPTSNFDAFIVLRYRASAAN